MHAEMQMIRKTKYYFFPKWNTSVIGGDLTG